MLQDERKHLLMEPRIPRRQYSLLQSKSEIEYNCKFPRKIVTILNTFEFDLRSEPRSVGNSYLFENFNAVQPCRLIYCDRKQGRNFVFPKHSANEAEGRKRKTIVDSDSVISLVSKIVSWNATRGSTKPIYTFGFDGTYL